jgi:hypothetical protein
MSKFIYAAVAAVLLLSTTGRTLASSIEGVYPLPPPTFCLDAELFKQEVLTYELTEDDGLSPSGACAFYFGELEKQYRLELRAGGGPRKVCRGTEQDTPDCIAD